MFRKPKSYSISKEDLVVAGETIENALIVCVPKQAFKDANKIPSQFEKIHENTYRIHLADINSESAVNTFVGAFEHLKKGEQILNNCDEFLNPSYTPTMP
jgi:hypothetical protein